jgi:GT2 family glycosyltransferase
LAEAAVIIPHYNDTVRLMRCLAALMPTVPADVEVVVVDNGSSQSLDQVRAAHPGLRIVTETQKGAAMARNRGVAETTAPRLFFLDCDCVPAPDWLATALAVADRGDLVGGTVTVFDETPPPRSGPEAFETVFAFDNARYIAEDGFSVTANLLTRRDVFAATGPLIPGLSEDIEWCRRATARGFSLVHAPELRVAHPTRADWPAIERKWRRLARELYGLHGQDPAARAAWALKALAMPLSIPVHAPKVLTHPGLNGPGERLAALGMLVRLRLLRTGWMLRQAAGGSI